MTKLLFLSSLHPLELGCDLAVSLLADGGSANEDSLEIHNHNTVY